MSHRQMTTDHAADRRSLPQAVGPRPPAKPVGPADARDSPVTPDEPTAPPSDPPADGGAPGTVRWYAWVLAFGIVAALVLLSVSLATVAPIEAPPPTEPIVTASRVEVGEGTWLRIVGAPVREDSAAATRPVGWGATAPEPTRLPPLLDPAGAGVFDIDWDVPAPLLAIRLAGQRVQIQGDLAAAGGEILLAGSYLLPSQVAGAAPGPLSNAQRVTVTLPPALDGTGHDWGDEAWVDGVNYADPVGVGLPLLRTGGYETRRVSASFTVADFATRDGAPFARIAPDLVLGLEAMRSVLGPITVISGYRHPLYNALPSVGGARDSRHMTGQAADVWSPTQSSIAIALAAVQTMGCGVGLGLGRNTVHVDVRGYLSTWTYPGAPLSASTFDRWIQDLCRGAQVAPPTPERRLDASWFALLGEGITTDEAEVIHTDAAAVADAVAEAETVAPPEPSLDDRIGRDLAPFATEAYERDGPGVVVVDLRDGADPAGLDLAGRAHYARIQSPEARRFDVRALARWMSTRPEGAYFLYAVRLPNDRVVTGVAPTQALPTRPAETVAPPEATPQETASPTPAPDPETWFVVVGSAESISGARDMLSRYEEPLRAAGLGSVMHAERTDAGTQYRVLIGPFADEANARQALDQAAGIVNPKAQVARFNL